MNRHAEKPRAAATDASKGSPRPLEIYFAEAEEKLVRKIPDKAERESWKRAAALASLDCALDLLKAKRAQGKRPAGEDYRAAIAALLCAEWTNPSRAVGETFRAGEDALKRAQGGEAVTGADRAAIEAAAREERILQAEVAIYAEAIPRKAGRQGRPNYKMALHKAIDAMADLYRNFDAETALDEAADTADPNLAPLIDEGITAAEVRKMKDARRHQRKREEAARHPKPSA